MTSSLSFNFSELCKFLKVCNFLKIHRPQRCILAHSTLDQSRDHSTIVAIRKTSGKVDRALISMNSINLVITSVNKLINYNNGEELDELVGAEDYSLSDTDRLPGGGDFETGDLDNYSVSNSGEDYDPKRFSRLDDEVERRGMIHDDSLKRDSLKRDSLKRDSVPSLSGDSPQTGLTVGDYDLQNSRGSLSNHFSLSKSRGLSTDYNLSKNCRLPSTDYDLLKRLRGLSNDFILLKYNTVPGDDLKRGSLSSEDSFRRNSDLSLDGIKRSSLYSEDGFNRDIRSFSDKGLKRLSSVSDDTYKSGLLGDGLKRGSLSDGSLKRHSLSSEDSFNHSRPPSDEFGLLNKREVTLNDNLKQLSSLYGDETGFESDDKLYSFSRDDSFKRHGLTLRDFTADSEFSLTKKSPVEGKGSSPFNNTDEPNLLNSELLDEKIGTENNDSFDSGSPNDLSLPDSSISDLVPSQPVKRRGGFIFSFIYHLFLYIYNFIVLILLYPIVYVLSNLGVISKYEFSFTNGFHQVDGKKDKSSINQNLSSFDHDYDESSIDISPEFDDSRVEDFDKSSTLSPGFSKSSDSPDYDLSFHHRADTNEYSDDKLNYLSTERLSNERLKQEHTLSNSIKSPTSSSKYFIPPPQRLVPLSRNPHKKKLKKQLILDLDETLIHSLSRSSPRSFNSSAGKMIEIKINNISSLYFVHKRPFCDYFLQQLYQWYDLQIFTASVKEYADPIIDWLEQDVLNLIDKKRKLSNNKIFSKRYYRNDCTYRPGIGYIKDLSKLVNKNDDLKNVIIIDNSPVSYALHESNAIMIEGWINDQSDRDLLNLLPMLQSLSFCIDVRYILGLRSGEKAFED